MKKTTTVPFKRSPDEAGISEALLANHTYVEALYTKWLRDPSTVTSDWNHFFRGFVFAAGGGRTASAVSHRQQTEIARLVSTYRNLGYLAADTDPLGNYPRAHPALALENFGFSEEDLDTVFDTYPLAAGVPQASLREIIKILNTTYCGTVGVEFDHVLDTRVRHWLEDKMEPAQNNPKYSRERKLEILERLIDAEIFETFLQNRFPGQKRFSLEGGESLIPALHFLIEEAGEKGISSIIVGMAHRGRLNVLVNILEKPYALIFSEFEDVEARSAWGDGDVKYHMGYFCERKTRSGREVAISLAANPSHLEAVDPVVQGRTRAKQRRLGDTEKRSRVLPLLIHGDAAFAGQGLVAETFNLSQLAGYRTGGTVHFVINNQIGFTTPPRDARSTCFPTDIAKMIEAPVLHVNGDDPEAVVHVAELALQFRQEFHRDVVIDMICYRRHGHNEADEPAFTQPLLYKRIKDRPSVRTLYTGHIVETGDLSPDQVEQATEDFKKKLQRAFDSAKEHPPKDVMLPFDRYWEGLDNPYSHDQQPTGVDHNSLIRVAQGLTHVPEGFRLNPKIAKHLPRLMEAVTGKHKVDWAAAELLAFGTLLSEGFPVRLSGQDSARGTFSQRHAVWTDSESQREHIPLNHIHNEQARFCVYNSMLSEAAVLGFDYGYSLGEPYMLVMWEAQFGDFANGAQVIIDQFIVSSQSKWHRTSGLVMLLPHGYEGQGPDHSNAYLERYLAACAEDNIQVCNLTTPAQYFHVLRRQLKRDFRRPLIIMTPKSLLRHPRVVSPLQEFMEGRFREVLDDPRPPGQPRRLVFCSGKVFYELLEAREDRGADDVAIVRIEQFYPLHRELLISTAKKYPSVEEVVWCQEEPQNRGGWTFMNPFLRNLFPEKKILYVGRPASASPATGSHRVHRQEQERLLRQALILKEMAHASETSP